MTKKQKMVYDAIKKSQEISISELSKIIKLPRGDKNICGDVHRITPICKRLEEKGYLTSSSASGLKKYSIKALG